MAAGFGVATGAAAFAFGLSAGLAEGCGVGVAGGVSETCAGAFAVNIRKVARPRIGRTIFISGPSSLPSLGFGGGSRIRLPDRLLGLSQRRRRAARIGPDEIAGEDEIRSARCELAGFLKRFRKADAGRFEQFIPPLQ